MNTNPSCWACKGTGTDELFLTPCTECVPSASRWTTLDRISVEEPERPTGNGAGTTHTYRSDGPVYRWAKNDADGKWVVRGPRGAEDTTVLVTKASGETADVSLGAVIGAAKAHGEVLYALARKAPPARPERTSAPTGALDLSGLTSGRYGVPGGDTRLKVRIQHAEKGNWAGWVFVDDGAEYGSGEKYGRQRPGGTYAGQITEQLAAILADPKGALRRYAELTGRCGYCDRTLEDEVSVARGVGPVCAKRHGWQ